MKIFGQEYGFKLTVGASAEIAKLCPDGDMERIGEVLNGSFADTIDFTAAFIEAMARGYDGAELYAGKEITHKPLTAEMVKALPISEFRMVQDVALKAFTEDTQSTVELAPAKKKRSPQA